VEPPRNVSRKRRFFRAAFIEGDPRLPGYNPLTLLKAIRDNRVYDLISLLRFAQEEGQLFSGALTHSPGSSTWSDYPTQSAVDSLRALLATQLVKAEGLEVALDSVRALFESQLAKANSEGEDFDPEYENIRLHLSNVPPVTISVSPQWQRIQQTLNISLTVLTELQRPRAMVICPQDIPQVHADEEKDHYDVFVLMPFLSKIRPVYEDHIKNVCKRLSVSVGRADDFFTVNSVMADVWSGIKGAKAIVADCTGRNPNVFYEIGLAHVLSKKVVLLTQKTEDIPFDIRHLRHIKYEFTHRGGIDLENALETTLSAIFSNVSP
jgi:hypothetical protein